MLCVALGFLIIQNNANAQQVLDSANVLYIDNTSDNRTTPGIGSFMDDPQYKEFPQTQIAPGTADIYGWWTNNGSFWLGGNSRRASYYGSGNNTGAHAHWYCSIQESGYYVVYHNMWAGNATSDAYVTFTRFGEAAAADSFRYNMQFNNTPEDLPSWYPLGMIFLFAGDSALTVEIGLDSLGSNTLRSDAIALVKSNEAGPDLEFGARRFTRTVIDPNTLDTLVAQSFYKERAPFPFQPTDFNGENFTERKLSLYNIGGAALTVSGFETQTNRFYVATPAPFTIPAGGKMQIAVRFDPKGEEITYDTLYILSDDPNEPAAWLPLRGEGINYNFIMNASMDGSEPHWNIEGGVFEKLGAGWAASTASKFVFPIPDGNKHSIVMVNGPQSEAAAIYRFQIPDDLYGNYYLEHSGPTTSNAAISATVEVVTPFISDTMRVTGFDQNQTGSVYWSRIGGNRIFPLNGGGETIVKYTNPGAGLLRADLMRARKVPIAPDISTNRDPQRLVNFGSVSIYDSIRLAEFNYQRNLIIGSNGETPLVIDSIVIAQGTLFQIDNMPTFPLTLPAVDGEFNMLISFLPDFITIYTDTIRIYSNDPNEPMISILLSGQGVGTGITVDDEDPSTYIYPEVLTWTGAPDPENMDKWYRISGQGGINQTRLLTYIYFNPPDGLEKVEWFPNFPFKPDNPVNEVDSFDVYVQVPVSSPNSTPAAKYLIKHYDGVDTVVISQLYRTLNQGKIPLGRYKFLRGGQDYPGSGTIFGSVELVNDTALVSQFYIDSLENTARRDSFFLRADALILEQASNVVSVTEPTLIPMEFSLSQNYPNPFNPTTQIRFSIPVTSAVELKIFDILGREVATLLKGEHNPGVYTVEWNGRNNYGAPVSSGIYIYRITAGKFVQSKKMMMVK